MKKVLTDLLLGGLVFVFGVSVWPQSVIASTLTDLQAQTESLITLAQTLPSNSVEQLNLKVQLLTQALALQKQINALVQDSNQNTGVLRVTAPNGGEQWQLGSLHTVLWSPYSATQRINVAGNQQVRAYLLQSENGNLINKGEVIESGKASIHWAGDLDAYGRYPAAGENYYIKLVNNQTGETDVSDAPFTLLPQGTITAKLLVNGSHADITSVPAEGQDFTASWTSNASKCGLSIGSADQDSYRQYNNLLPNGDLTIRLNPNSHGVSLWCESTGAVEGSAWDYVNGPYVYNNGGGKTTIQVVSPSGGTLNLNNSTTIAWTMNAVSKVSIGLYKNDASYEWITRDMLVEGGVGSYNWTPSQTIPASELANGAVYKIYIIGYRPDGTGTVEDKGDAAFSITNPANTQVYGAVLNSPVVTNGEHVQLSWSPATGPANARYTLYRRAGSADFNFHDIPSVSSTTVPVSQGCTPNQQSMCFVISDVSGSSFGAGDLQAKTSGVYTYAVVARWANGSAVISNRVQASITGSGAVGSLQIVSPNGGETLFVNNYYTVSVTQTQNEVTYKLLRLVGSDYEDLGYLSGNYSAPNISWRVGYYYTTDPSNVSLAPDGRYKIAIKTPGSLSYVDVSNSVFSILNNQANTPIQARPVYNLTACRVNNRNVRLNWTRDTSDTLAGRYAIYRRDYAGVPRRWMGGTKSDIANPSWTDDGSYIADESGRLDVPVASGTYYYTVIVESPSNDRRNSPMRQVVVTPNTPSCNASSTSGSFMASLDSSAPSYTIVGSSEAVSATGIVVNQIKLRASNESVILTKLSLKLTSGLASDLAQITVWDGTTQIGTAIFTGISTTATSTFPVMVLLPKDQDKVLTIKADFAGVGPNQPGTAGSLVKIDFGHAEGAGLESGMTLYGTGSTQVAGIRLMRSHPTVALDTLPSGGVADGRLMRFKVTASPSGSISIAQFALNVAVTGASVSNLNIFAFTDASYSVPADGVANAQVSANNVSMGATSGSKIGISASNASDGVIVIPAGATHYFEVRGSVAGTSVASAVVTALLGDSSYQALANTLNAGISSIISNFVWSPNSQGVATITSADWTNGFGVIGLPSSGLVQMRIGYGPTTSPTMPLPTPAPTATYSAEVIAPSEIRITEGQPTSVTVSSTNKGTADWQNVRLSYHIYASEGEARSSVSSGNWLLRDGKRAINGAGTIIVEAKKQAGQALAPGVYWLRWDMVREGASDGKAFWFSFVTPSGYPVHDSSGVPAVSKLIVEPSADAVAPAPTTTLTNCVGTMLTGAHDASPLINGAGVSDSRFMCYDGQVYGTRRYGGIDANHEVLPCTQKGSWWSDMEPNRSFTKTKPASCSSSASASKSQTASSLAAIRALLETMRDSF